MILSLYSCDKPNKCGIYEYKIHNQSSAQLNIYIFESNETDSIKLNAYNDIIFVSKWNEMDGVEMRPNYLDSDSAQIIFNENKKIIFYKSSNNLVNNKNILNEYTYDEEILPSSERNEENKRFTFIITEQDYLIADSF